MQDWFGGVLAGDKRVTYSCGVGPHLHTGSTPGAHRQRLWAAVPFTFTVKTLDVILFTFHFHP